MYLVGLTGGIGSGKSTLAVLLAERGAQVIDADEIGREALRPGEPAWNKVVEVFGDEILVPGTMDVDRKRLGGIVFNHPEKLAALNAIVHPVIVRRIADELDKLRTTDSVVVLDAALIIELGMHEGLDALVVVTAREKARTDRLVAARGMTVDDVRAVMSSQLDPEELVAKADIVVRNDGTLEQLAGEADRVMEEIAARRSAAS